MSYNGTIEVAVNDVDFYQRKIIRLEDDISILHDELAKVRARLRVAQDYEIKYNILLTNSQQDIRELKDKLEAKVTPREAKKGEEVVQVQSESKWQKRQYQLQQKIRNQVEKEVGMLRSERDEYQRKIHELSARNQDTDILALKIKKLEKENQALKQQIEDNRIHLERKKQEDMSELKGRLNQNFKERMEGERKMFQGKIAELEKKLIEQEVSKDHEIFKLPVSNNKELAAIKELYGQLSETHKREKDELQEMLLKKNKEIQQLLEEKSQADERYKYDMSKKEEEIGNLGAHLLEKEKEHQRQITTALHKLNDMREKELAAKNEQIKELQADSGNQKKWWTTKLLNHDKEIQELTQKYEEEIKKLQENKNELKEKIAELSKRLKEHEGQRAAGQTQLMINSLRDMDQREKHMGSYEDGITYLEGQLTRCQHKLEEKIRAVEAVNKEIATIRAEAADEAAQMFAKTVAIKEEYDGKVAHLQKRIAELNEELRRKEKEVKSLKRENIVKENQYAIEVNKLKFDMEELRKDYKRVIESKKEAEADYRAEREKALGSNTDIMGVKKEKWLQMESLKQKLEGIFREKEEQMRLKYEGELQHRASELAQLKHQQHLADKDNQLLQQQNRKLRDELQCNKENCRSANYHHKLATVNLELALTQNIYEKLVQAKCRSGDAIELSEQRQATEYDNREDGIAFKTESQEPMLLSVDPSSFKKQQNE